MAKCSHPPDAIRIESLYLSLTGKVPDGRLATTADRRIEILVSCGLCKRMESIHQARTAAKWALRGLSRLRLRDDYLDSVLRMVHFDDPTQPNTRVYLSTSPCEALVQAATEAIALIQPVPEQVAQPSLFG